MIREDGSRVVTLRNPGGYILERTRVLPGGRKIALLSQSPQEVYSYDRWDDWTPPETYREETIDYARADREQLRDALVAQPVYRPDRTFPLEAVRDNERLRSLEPAIDLPINFEAGSSAILPSEVDQLRELGEMMSDIINQNPSEMFLIEGHSDAVGSNLANLALSDRRAESVALALTQYYDIPPENLVVQGYGEQFLKEQTDEASAVNRRVTVRRITPLIDQVASE